MGLGWIITGLLFFIVPSYGMIDVLPDFLGALMIIKGAGKMRDFNEDIESAHGNFTKLLFIDLAKTAVMPFIYSVKDETTVMTFTFIFAIIEAILLFYGLKSLADGVNYIASRADSKKADENYNGVHMICVIFSIASYSLLVIPQLVVLANPEYSVAVDIESLFTLYDYKNLITVVCMVMSFVLGVIFYSTVFKYFNNIRKEKKLSEFIKQKRETSEKYEKIVLCRRCKTAFSFIFAGFIFTSSFLVQGVDIIPMPVAFALVGIGSLMLCKILKQARLLAALSFVFTTLGFGTYGFSVYVQSNYFRALSVTAEIERLYKIDAICKAAEYAMLAVLIFVIGFVLFKMIADHTGRDFSNPSAYQMKYSEAEKKNLKRSVIAAIVALGAVSALLGAVMSFKFMEKEVFWLISAAVSLLWAVFAGIQLTKIYDAFENKYM